MRTWKCRWPGSTSSFFASSRLVRCSSLPVPSVSSTRRRSGWPSAFSCSGRSSVRTSNMGLGSGAATLPYIYDTAPCCLALQPRRGGGVGHEPGAPTVGADQARRGRAVRRPGERSLDRLGLRLARDDEDDLRGRAENGHRHRHPSDERLELRLGRDRASVTLLERRLAREERGDVAVRPETEQYEAELDPAEVGVVLLGCGLRAELPSDPLDLTRLRGQVVEQVLAREPVVRAGVPGRDAALVSPPEGGRAPVRPALRGQLVGTPRRLAAGERDRRPRARRFHQRVRNDRGDFLLVLGLNELDAVERHGSPAASSRERSMAACMALRKAARTPARSSSRIARIVVPPGEVTCSRSSTGCTCSSRSSFAVPSIVWTTSCVEISRESPSRIPASIIASASSAKYAGPEPDTAVTASMQRSGTRTTAPRWLSASSARLRFSSPACAPAQTPAIPSCTVAGRLGMARTTGTPSVIRPSIAEVGIAAATDSTVCSGVSRPPTSPSSTSKSCGLTEITTSVAPATASAFDVVARTP